MYKYIEAAHIALTSILSHKLRSFLTLLGVIIGVAVVTAVATVIEGANVYIKEKIATLGSGVFSLQKASITSFGDFQKFIDAWKRNPDLTLETSWGDWIDMSIRGEDPRRAMLRRKLRPHGSLRTLMRMQRIFPR